ncbi:spermine oxidase-like [Physella acuta]|uniref:spermine oxidase-like n=1 Tax=Physella acuta TaxID=109671 RepID=UPI0027DC0997|nr:spermine oxidase-like [Physella acuta]
MQTTKVVIVGAGTAGVTAAAWLLKHGVSDVIILEAQDYVGGRVKAEVVDNTPIDLGAQFVHGRDGNPAFYIAERLGMEFYPTTACLQTQLINSPPEFLTSSGHRVSQRETGALVEHLTRHLLKEAGEEPVEIDDRGQNEGECYERAYDQFLEANNHTLTPRLRELYDAIFRWYCAYQTIDTSAYDLKDLSVWALSIYKVLKGHRFTYVKGGITAILKAIADLLPPNIIHLNTPVAHIDWSDVSKTPKLGKCRVTCENGRQYLSDYVIVTVSIGCLQSGHRKLFKPELPRPLQSAINHIGFGGIGKIFLIWNEPFVGYTTTNGVHHVESFDLLWLDSAPVVIHSDRCPQKTRYGKPWWYGLHAAETVYGSPNILELWLNKDQASIMEQLDETEVKDVCHEVLQTFFKHLTIPKPVDMCRTKWISNPYIQGTYSYISSRIRREDLKHLGQPLPSPENPRLLFAGEGYAHEFISTFHGAILSGQGQANLILQDLGQQTSHHVTDLFSERAAPRTPRPRL